MSSKNIYLLIIFIIVSIFFFKLFLNPSSIIFSDVSDMINYGYYEKYFYINSIEQSGLPLWYPMSGSRPFISNPLIWAFYPFNLPFFIFNIGATFGWIIFLHVLLTYIFTFLYFKELKFSNINSLIGASAFTFSSVIMYKIFAGHLPHLLSITWIPLIFLFLERLMNKVKFYDSLFLGIILALQILAGHLQYVGYTAVVVVFYILGKIAINKEIRARLFPKLSAYLLVSIIVALLLSSVQLLPTIGAYKYFSSLESRSSYEQIAYGSLSPELLITFVLPNFFGSGLNHTYWASSGMPWELVGYIGIIPIILAGISLLYIKKDKQIALFAALAAFALLFSLGKYTPLFKLFYYLPFIKVFQWPSRMMVYLVFFLSVLAVYGIFQLKQSDSKKILKILLLFSIFAIFALIFSFVLKDSIIGIGYNLIEKNYSDDSLKWKYTQPIEYYLDKVKVVYSSILKDLISLTIFLSLFSVLLLAKKRLKYFSLFILLLVLVDLWWFGMPFIEFKDEKQLFEKTEIVSYLAADNAYFRVYDQYSPNELESLISEPIIVRNNLQKVYSGVSFTLSYHDDYIEDYYRGWDKNLEEGGNSDMPTLDLLNVKYILTKNKLDNDDLEFIMEGRKDFIAAMSDKEDQRIYLYRNANYLPRAFVIGTSKEYSKDVDMNKVNFREIVFIEDAPIIDNSYFSEAAVGFYSPNKIIVNATLEKPGYLVLSEIWHPNWKVYDNGIETKLYRANRILRAVYLEQGQHEIVFVYEDKYYRYGLYITIASLILILIILTYYYKKYIKLKA